MVQLVYPLKTQINRGVFTRMLGDNFPNLRGSIEYRPNRVVITFIHDITSDEKKRLDTLIARLNRSDSDWRNDWVAARKEDAANAFVSYRGTVIQGTVIPFDARGRLLARKVGMLLDEG